MADIELVIKINEDIAQGIIDGENDEPRNIVRAFQATIADAIKNGTPLPKGHGRLIDADELYGDFIDGTEGYDCQTWYRIEIGDIIEDAPTIIDADKSESEE